MQAAAPSHQRTRTPRTTLASSSSLSPLMDSSTQSKNRIVSTPGLSLVAPLGNISNKVLSSSADETMSRQETSRKTSRVILTSDDGGDVRPRVGSRTSLGGRRSLSGAKGAPSALRRLPPGVPSRSVVPSLSAVDDANAPGSSTAAPSSRPAVAALARVNQSGGPRRSLGASINAAASGGMAQHDREVREVVKLNVDSTNFEEWMKMATDNKINATNTWNFALIDYFHDMSLLRSDTGDGSINFQKASCTLDGCVKVWTSRVDSVVVETGKLLSGLQDEGKESGSKSARTRAGGEEGGDEGAEDDEDENGTAGRKKRSRAREPTLAKSFAQLAVKKLDLEFTVDPLFKKTSADFDEGGAGGLLMNHLGVDSNARVVFDAGDVAGVGEGEEGETDLSHVIEGEEGEEVEQKREEAALQDKVDLHKLRNKLFSQLDSNSMDVDEEGGALNGLLTDLVICPTFSSFLFAPGDDTPFTALASDSADVPPSQQHVAILQALEEDDGQGDFVDAPGFDDDGQDDAFGGDPFGGPPGDFAYLGDPDEDGAGDAGSEVGPASGPIDFSAAFQGITDEQGATLNGDGFFDYFDQRLAKNWAGPEHWKMRSVGLGAPPGQRADGTVATGGEKVSRKSKEPFVVDFGSEEGAVLARELFEPAKSGITLPQQKDTSLMESYLLPEDRHFSSRQLLRLFIKPRAMLNLKRKGMAVTTVADDNQAGPHPADIDEEFWARSAAARESSQGEEDVGGLPFDTPFFHDAEDDGAFDGLDEGAGMLDMDPNAEDEELATQALKRIRPEFVNYAKKAKRVDVRKLKENIWRQLAIEAEVADEDDEEDEQGDDSATPRATRRAARLSESLQPRVFQSVLSGLRKTYAKDRMDEISTSFCFICLLHLANEEGLQIKTADSPAEGLVGTMARMAEKGAAVTISEEDDALGGDDDEGDDREGEEGHAEGSVGFLEQLSIAKDPNAGRSA